MGNRVRYVGEECVTGLEEGCMGVPLKGCLGKIRVCEVHAVGEGRREVAVRVEEVT